MAPLFAPTRLPGGPPSHPPLAVHAEPSHGAQQHGGAAPAGAWHDAPRVLRALLPAPRGGLVAACDSLGRVLLLDGTKLTLLRMWKVRCACVRVCVCACRDLRLFWDSSAELPGVSEVAQRITASGPSTALHKCRNALRTAHHATRLPHPLTRDSFPGARLRAMYPSLDSGRFLSIPSPSFRAFLAIAFFARGLGVPGRAVRLARGAAQLVHPPPAAPRPGRRRARRRPAPRLPRPPHALPSAQAAAHGRGGRRARHRLLHPTAPAAPAPQAARAWRLAAAAADVAVARAVGRAAANRLAIG